VCGADVDLDQKQADFLFVVVEATHALPVRVSVRVRRVL
jgi:hypothetical protein